MCVRERDKKWTFTSQVKERRREREREQDRHREREREIPQEEGETHNNQEGLQTRSKKIIELKESVRNAGNDRIDAIRYD